MKYTPEFYMTTHTYNFIYDNILYREVWINCSQLKPTYNGTARGRNFFRHMQFFFFV